jgi:hypothetical protein
MVPPHICLVEELIGGGSLFDALHRRSGRRHGASPLAYPRVRGPAPRAQSSLSRFAYTLLEP